MLRINRHLISETGNYVEKLTTETFVKRAKTVHGDRYGYEKVAYVNTDTKVIITCPQHDDFEQTPHNHLNGHVCLACSGRKKLTTETFIKKAKAIHGDKYSYNNVAYIQNKAKVIITCPEHGDFEQTPNGHLMGQSCPTCGGTKQLTTETFIEKAKAVHGDKCSYDKVEYEKIYDKVMLTCPEHGDFEQVAHDHLRRNGCGKCINKAEGKIAIHLNERFIMHRQHRVENKFFDFYLPKYNLLIERDGEQHYQIVGH